MYTIGSIILYIHLKHIKYINIYKEINRDSGMAFITWNEIVKNVWIRSRRVANRGRMLRNTDLFVK